MKWSSNLCSPSCWLLAFSLCFFSLNSFASTEPQNGWFGGGQYGLSSSSSLCSALGYTYFTGGYHQTVNPGAFYIAGVGYYHTYNGAEFGWCTNQQGSTNGAQIYQADLCPDDPSAYTMIGGRMKCGTGPLVEDCPGSGTTKKATIALSGINGQQGIGASMCADSGGSSCGIKCNSGMASYNEVSGQSSVYCESYEFTGTTCAPTDPQAVPVASVPAQNQATPLNSPPKSKQDCPGGSGFAEVNNVGMCLPSGTAISAGAQTQTSASGSVTTSSTTVINKGGTSTTTTTSTYKDAAGNTTYSGTGTSTTGLNQAGVPGQGDKPNLGDAPTFDSTLPQEATFNIKAQGNPVFSTEIFASTPSCPAPITFSVMGRDFSINFDMLCSFADVIRGIVLLLSAIAALRSLVTN